MRNLAVLSLSLLALLGCERGAQRPDAGATEAQQAAARDACFAQALATQAEESLTALQEWGSNDGPMVSITSAAAEFARAYLQHAQLRHGALAHADSAMNHARTPADSTRFMRTAESFLPRGVEPETLEANVASAWIQSYAALRSDQDHRCNWDI